MFLLSTGVNYFYTNRNEEDKPGWVTEDLGWTGCFALMLPILCLVVSCSERVSM